MEITILNAMQEVTYTQDENEQFLLRSSIRCFARNNYNTEVTCEHSEDGDLHIYSDSPYVLECIMKERGNIGSVNHSTYMGWTYSEFNHES